MLSSFPSHDQFGEWNVPVNHVIDVEASIINNWWRSANNVYVTFNTSDTADMWITRITNNVNPFTGVTRPYNNYSFSNINLQTIKYSLDY